jgi:hypothetical protein
MKSVFIVVDGWIPQLPGGENAIAFEDTRDGEQKKDLVEGAVTDTPRYQYMSCQDTRDTLIPMGHHPLSRGTDPHPSPLSSCLMRPCCCMSGILWIHVHRLLLLCASAWDYPMQGERKTQD